MLLATLVLIGVLFYQVIQPFIFSLLFATVLAVLFRPLYRRVTIWLGNRPRVAAGVTTTGIMLLILLPLGGALVVAGFQLFDVTQDVAALLKAEPIAEQLSDQLPEQRQTTDDGARDSDDVAEEEDESTIAKGIKQFEQSQFVKTVNEYYFDLSIQHRKRIESVSSQAADGFVKKVYERTVGLVGDAINSVIGLVVTALALYYMFADGQTMLRQAKDLLPLDDAEEDALIEQFGKVCRGVIIGTVVAALGQAIMAGIGFAVAGVPNVLLLMAVTMFFAFIPFVGAGSIVTLVSLWLFLDGRSVAAILLLTYGLLVVSTMDNLVRAWVIGSEAKMNPLVAFITVVGALQLIGLWGIFVGPLIAAFFYTLLRLLRERIVREEPKTSSAAG
jgi:predicted PurR-regulated permease PerM